MFSRREIIRELEKRITPQVIRRARWQNPMTLKPMSDAQIKARLIEVGLEQIQFRQRQAPHSKQVQP